MVLPLNTQKFLPWHPPGFLCCFEGSPHVPLSKHGISSRLVQPSGISNQWAWPPWKRQIFILLFGQQLSSGHQFQPMVEIDDRYQNHPTAAPFILWMLRVVISLKPRIYPVYRYISHITRGLGVHRSITPNINQQEAWKKKNGSYGCLPTSYLET